VIAWQTLMEIYAQEGRAVLTVPLPAATGPIATNISALISLKEFATMYESALALSQHGSWPTESHEIKCTIMHDSCQAF
jgi:hypothetical protein